MIIEREDLKLFRGENEKGTSKVKVISTKYPKKIFLITKQNSKIHMIIDEIRNISHLFITMKA